MIWTFYYVLWKTLAYPKMKMSQHENWKCILPIEKFHQLPKKKAEKYHFHINKIQKYLNRMAIFLALRLILILNQLSCAEPSQTRQSLVELSRAESNWVKLIWAELIQKYHSLNTFSNFVFTKLLFFSHIKHTF